jgi:hypothetical protein
MSIKYAIASVIFKLIPNDLIPRNIWGDKIWSLRKFLREHKRLPSNKLIFNDVLFKIKNSDEITDPLRIFTTDKEFVKLFVKSIVGDKYNVPTIAVLRNITEIDTFIFPETCCIKPTQGCGKVIFRKDNEELDVAQIKDWFKLNYYKPGRERNYKNLKPKVIVEPIIFGGDPLDYKIFCFNGKPKMIQVDFDRFSSHSRNLYDIHWNELPFSTKSQKKPSGLTKPENLNELLEIAQKLSEYFTFVRIDLYTNSKEIMVGEITHCAENALGTFYPSSAEIDASKLIFES